MKDIEKVELLFAHGEDGISLTLPNSGKSAVLVDGKLTLYFSEGAGLAIAAHLAEEYGLIATVSKELQ